MLLHRLLTIVLSVFAFNYLQAADLYEHGNDFIDSFARHYDCTPEGRFVHEYHPYLLQKTATSFGLLEQNLVQNDFALHGRIVICGYEEGAVPSYYTDYRRSKINDEGRVRSKTSEWSLRPHNRFGVMTGFLFKDCPTSGLFSHIDADSMQVFDPRATIFQEHAFGDALPLMRKAYQLMAKALHKKDSAAALKILVSFWQSMYSYSLKIGNKQLAGTQDILFSIEYACYLQQAKAPIIRFFVGPDVTYPIEVSCRQKAEATRHAQSFLREFAPMIVPVDGQSTVYIFGSFVDGVGKSTSLGNIKNMMRFGDQVNLYQHVDNTSSQFSEVFKYADNVYIADLPAQISHFTYKPDGQVYVDAGAEVSSQELARLQDLVNTNHNQWSEQYKQLLAQVRQEITKNGFFAPSLVDVSMPERVFVRNLVLLKRHGSNTWIPFSDGGKHYLFDAQSMRDVRVLVPLEHVRSEGIKNIESEQMLFDGGIKFPAQFQVFIDDLIKKLKTVGVQRVVFVDFLSMYSRSSRENPRINYLLQQMALLDQSFDPKNSLYHHFTHGAELLAHLLDSEKSKQISNGLVNESLIRAGLFAFLEHGSFESVTSVSVEQLTQQLQAYLRDVPTDLLKNTQSQFAVKVDAEQRRLTDLFGMSKRFMNVMQTDYVLLVRFSKMLVQFFREHVCLGEPYDQLWVDPGIVKIGATQDGASVTMRSGEQCVSLARVPVGCRLESSLAPMLRMVRACWYAALTNLMSCIVQEDDTLMATVPLRAPLVPLFLKPGEDRHLYVLQRRYDPCEAELSYENHHPFALYNLLSYESADYVTVQETILRANWASKDTCSCIFNVDSWVGADPKQSQEMVRGASDLESATMMLSTLVVQRHHAEHGADQVMSMHEFYQKIKRTLLWQHALQRMYKDSTTSIETYKSRKARYMVVPDVMYPTIRILVRLLATMDMIVKDPDSNVVTRFGDRDDFRAALKVIEKLIVPRYYGALVVEPLFTDYNEVQPYPSWDYWERKRH